MYGRRQQHGQTILIVAVSMVGVLTMAALAIDLTTLYVARAEIQRAADSAALAGAKAFADSGVTSSPGNTGLQGVAQQLANSYATSAASQNNVAGSSAQLVSSPTLDFSLQGNPRITVRLQKTGLPVFFARIFGTTAASVAATATAEAYNPSFSQAGAGSSFIPSAPKCVKPFLVPNLDPNPNRLNQPFVDEATGAVKSDVQLGEPISLKSPCKGNRQGQSGCNAPNYSPSAGDYVAMLTSAPHTYCPSDAAPGCGGGTSDFEQSIECCDGTTFDFKQCGTSANLATWDSSFDPSGPNKPAQNGLQCLIHTTSNGRSSQQDSLDPTNFMAGSGPPQISPGTFNQARYNLGSNALVNTSDSIITVPLFQVPNTPLAPNSTVTVVGYLQLFVNRTGPGNSADMDAYLLNVIGCANTGASAAPVSGGGVSAIPVRLIDH